MTQMRKDQTDNRNKNPSDKDDHAKGKQGFASMSKEQVREIAAKGGRHSHEHGTDPTKKEK
jgi:general stress protein YciG